MNTYNENDTKRTGKIILVVACLITIVCMIIGATSTVTKTIKFFNGKSGDEKTETTSFDTDEFSSIDMKISCAEVIVKSGAKNEVETTYSNAKFKPTAEVKDGVLVIKQKGKTNVSVNNFKELKTTITVTVAGDLDSFDASLNMGDMTITGITASTSNIDCDMGNVEASNCNFNTLDTECNMGNVEFDKIEVNTLTTDCDMGNIEINVTGKLSDYTINANCDLGEIEVGGKSFKEKASQVGDGDKAMSLSCDMGNITVE